MPAEYHELSPPPTTVLWRYMDFPKFVAMLERGGLYCTRANRLGDPFEGTFTPQSVEAFATRYNMAPDRVHDWAEIVRTIRRNSHVCCWHEGEVESAALWRIYGNSIAIRSTFARLRQFLSPHFYIGRVTYIDYETEHPDITSSVGALLFKRRSFEHEREVRAISQYHTYAGSAEIPCEHPSGFPGEYELGNIDSLIESVVVAPQSPLWFFELVFRVSQTYGLTSLCHRSAIDVAPPASARLPVGSKDLLREEVGRPTTEGSPALPEIE